MVTPREDNCHGGPTLSPASKVCGRTRVNLDKRTLSGEDDPAIRDTSIKVVPVSYK